MNDRPVAVTRALQTLVALCVGAGVVTLLVWVFREDLVLAWAEGNPGARAILRDGGLEAVEANLNVPGFVPVVLTSYLVFLMLAWVFAVFFWGGFAWGRVCLVGVAVFGIFLAVLAVASGIPTLFEVLCGGVVLLCGAQLFYLLHPQTSRWFREV